MSSRLANHLDAVRHRLFVGRDAERALFQSVLTAAKLPFHVLYLFGPGGVGKTSLWYEFAHICDEAQIPTIYLNARDVEPAPDSFIHALQLAMELEPSESPLEVLARAPRRRVMAIDTYETLAPLDGWLRQVFLPQLPEDTLIVLAGRAPPSASWRADPGWQTVIHTLPLRNLSPEESRAYLRKRAVPQEEHEKILAFTRGHPLALSLVADVFDQRPGLHFQPTAVPDVLKMLLEQLLQQVPGPAHRVALEACALVRVTSEPLLAAMLGTPLDLVTAFGSDSEQGLQQDPNQDVGHGVHELFEWLRGLSFTEFGPRGLHPHDLAREVLATDLRWRNPDWYAELHRRARTYYAARLRSAHSHEQQRILLDHIYLHRDNPVVRPFFEWQTTGSVLPDTMQDDDIPALLSMVRRHEGRGSAHLAAYWFERRPQGVLIFRSAAGEPAGFMATVALHQSDAQDLQADPAVAAVWHYLERHAPLRPGEGATLFRFWMARDTYQAVSPIQSLIFVNAVRHYLTTPGLAFTFFPCLEPDFWAAVFAYADLTRIREADFEVGGRCYGIYGHDWRVVPPMAWLALLAEREVADNPQAIPPPQIAERLVVLSETEFAAAVRDLLRDFSRPDALHGNPLLRSRLVVDRVATDAGEAERIAALRTLAKEAAEALQSSPRGMKFYRALYHTYLQPAPTQERAAELLDLPFSTFRRHLKGGITQVTEMLWQREIGRLEN
jgi:hypothetical protein